VRCRRVGGVSDAPDADFMCRKGSTRSGWSSLHRIVEGSGIQEHYSNGMMPMQLRMLAEEILGSNVVNPA